MSGPLFIDVVVVMCDCGFLPLNMHRTSQEAWEFAAAHVALNPNKCQPRMMKDTVPVAFAPKGKE